MPANLTPQYQKAEAEYRKAQTPEEQIDCLQLMLKLIPKHKGTEKLQADLKSRLKEAKAEVDAARAAPKKGRSHRIPRQGAGQIVLLGAPNSGKSRVLAELTNAHPEVADYAFTTREPMPGMMPWQDVLVQLIDTPPVTISFIEPYLTALVRSADAVALCLDGSSDDAPNETAAVISQFESRKTLLSTDSGFHDDDLSVVRIKTLLVVTRGSSGDSQSRLDYFREIVPTPFETLRVELSSEPSREDLRSQLYQLLDVIRVYTKRPGKPAELRDPFTLPRGSTVENLAGKVHRDLAESLSFAKLWGHNAFEGQSVGREHVLCDRDVVELHG